MFAVTECRAPKPGAKRCIGIGERATVGCTTAIAAWENLAQPLEMKLDPTNLRTLQCPRL